MNWLERAHREICTSARPVTANFGNIGSRSPWQNQKIDPKRGFEDNVAAARTGARTRSGWG